MDYAAIMNCGVDRWSSVWGELTQVGIVLMTCYGVVALLMLWVAARSTGRERWFWLLSSLLFLFMVANTHFDLHALPTAVGYCLSKAQRWHEQREEFRMTAMAGVAVFVGLTVLVLLMIFVRNIASNLLLVLGMGVIFAFTASKAIGHKEAERLYEMPVGMFSMADVVELSGIGIVLLGALWRLARPKRPVHPI